MIFKSYSDIENSYRKAFIDKIIEDGLDKQSYCIQEKVHGANYQFSYDGTELKTGSRTEFLSGGTFYNDQIVIEKYSDKIPQIYNYLQEYHLCFDTEHKYFKTLTIYGELFGGSYPHPDVEKKNIKQIQKGVFYTPDIEFYAFDITLDGEYISILDQIAIFEKFELFHAKILFQGTLQECLAYPNEYDSHIPEWLGLPPITPNTCEGNVIKSLMPTIFKYGRLIVKNKNERFTEKKMEHIERKPTVELSEVGNILKDALLGYATKTRLAAVLSKIGTVTQSDFGKLLGAYNSDVWSEFEKDVGLTFNALPEPEQKFIKKGFQALGASIIRPNFVNILDGNFDPFEEENDEG
jgi:Rnl2 family RNA ligase